MIAHVSDRDGGGDPGGRGGSCGGGGRGIGGTCVQSAGCCRLPALVSVKVAIGEQSVESNFVAEIVEAELVELVQSVAGFAASRVQCPEARCNDLVLMERSV